MNKFFEFLKTIKKTKKKYKRKSWFQRSQTSFAEWEAVRQSIWDLMKSRETVGDMCNSCGERDAQVKCLQCVEHSLCFKCDDQLHDSSPMHDRMVDGSKLLPTESFDPEEGITFKGLLKFIMSNKQI